MGSIHIIKQISFNQYALKFIKKCDQYLRIHAILLSAIVNLNYFIFDKSETQANVTPMSATSFIFQFRICISIFLNALFGIYQSSMSNRIFSNFFKSGSHFYFRNKNCKYYNLKTLYRNSVKIFCYKQIPDVPCKKKNAKREIVKDPIN